MAKINNQAVMQKLIDELKLYPGKDIIPTELADKILPTYQVNQNDVNVSIKPNYYLWQDVTDNDSDKTLTVPDGHTYIIKSGMVKYVSDATVGNRVMLVIVSDAAGNEIWFGEGNEQAASKTWYIRLRDSATAWTADVNNLKTVFSMPFPANLVLKENYTIRFYDYTPVSVAGDDMHISLLVEDIED